MLGSYSYSMGLESILYVCGALIAIFSIFAILGGIMALQRKMWALALVGSILGIFSWGYFISSILCLIGMILIAVSKNEFNS